MGRSVLHVRVCSCPKRDKDKDEKEFLKQGDKETPNGKKRKLDKSPLDTKDYKLSVNTVHGPDNIVI